MTQSLMRKTVYTYLTCILRKRDIFLTLSTRKNKLSFGTSFTFGIILAFRKNNIIDQTYLLAQKMGLNITEKSKVPA